jgi:hypothetical protein
VRASLLPFSQYVLILINTCSGEIESDPEEGTSTIAPSISSALSDVSKRKTEAERKMVLDTDPRAQEVKPGEVLCRKCQKWIKLSKSSRFALYNWISHQSRCSDPGFVSFLSPLFHTVPPLMPTFYLVRNPALVSQLQSEGSV